MITQAQIDETVTWSGLKKFGAFVLSHVQDGALPDYQQMDLMKIPRLVPHIFVLDLHEFPNTDEMIFNFAGQALSDVYEKNLRGEKASDVLKDAHNLKPISKVYRKAILEQVVGYSKRYAKIPVEVGSAKWRNTEALFFPCSSDGKTVNWGIGCVHYSTKNDHEDGVYLHF